MADTDKTTPTLISIRVELFGQARILSGRRHVEVNVPESARPHEIAAALAETCPDLVGKVILEDRSGLQESYTLNLNGTSFVRDEELSLRLGDTLLVFSSQAGG